MCRSTVLPRSLALALLASASASACTPAGAECLSPGVVYPVDTPEGLRIGTVVARARLPGPLEPSRFTGQPRTVVFNNPGSLPGSVDPEVQRVPLPRGPRFHTQAVFPRGY